MMMMVTTATAQPRKIGVARLMGAFWWMMLLLYGKSAAAAAATTTTATIDRHPASRLRAPPHLIQCRGGGGGGLFDRRPWQWRLRRRQHASYLRNLQNQNHELERQLRQSADELIQLRTQLSHARTQRTTWQGRALARHQQQTDAVERAKSQAAQIDAWQRQVHTLEQDLGQLRARKSELETTLHREQQRVTDLERQLEKARQQGDAQLAEWQAQLQQQHVQHEHDTQQQLDRLQRTLHIQHDRAIQTVRHEQQQALQDARHEQQRVLHDARQDLLADFQRQLATQQTAAVAALERERVKMRKLVKALHVNNKKEKKDNKKKVASSSSTSAAATINAAAAAPSRSGGIVHGSSNNSKPRQAKSSTVRRSKPP